MQQPVNWMPPMKSWLSATTNNRASLTTVLTTPPCKSKSYRASRVLWLGGNFVAGATISWKLLRVVVDWGEVAVVCLPVCYTTLRPAAAAWLESQVWTTEPKTVTPGSCQAFSPIFQLFRSCWYFFGAADTFQRQHPIQHILPPVIWILGGRFEDTVMAYRVIRMKKEARRNTKLDEIFQVTIVSKYSRYPLFQNIQGMIWNILCSLWLEMFQFLLFQNTVMFPLFEIFHVINGLKCFKGKSPYLNIPNTLGF